MDIVLLAEINISLLFIPFPSRVWAGSPAVELTGPLQSLMIITTHLKIGYKKLSTKQATVEDQRACFPTERLHLEIKELAFALCRLQLVAQKPCLLFQLEINYSLDCKFSTVGCRHKQPYRLPAYDTLSVFR